MNIQIRPPGVLDTGHEMAILADEAAGKIGTSLDASKSAASAHPGWESSGPLAQCAQAWEGHVRDLVGSLNQLGQQFLASGQSYTAADNEAERRILEVLQQLSGS